MSILIKNVIHSFQNQKVDIFVQDGIIKKIGKNLDLNAEKVIDGTDKILYPALSNMHTHAAMVLFKGYADDLQLMEWLQTKIWPIESRLTEEDVYWGTKFACLEMIKTGTTLFNDMYWHFEACYKAVEEMGMRAILNAVMIDMFDEERQKFNEKRTIEIFDKYFDKNPLIKVGLGPHAVYTVSEKGLRFAAEFRKEKDTFLHIHLSETLTEVEDCVKKTGKRPPEYLDSLGVLSSKTILAHCVWLNPKEIDLISKRNSIPVHNPVSNLKLAVGGIMPELELYNKKLRICLGTDGAASNNNLDLTEEMKLSAILQKWRNNNAEIPNAYQTLEKATEGFRVLGLKVNKLEEGDTADLILMKTHETITPLHNPVSNFVYASNGTLTDTVICNGKVLMENGYVKGEEKIKENFFKTVNKLFNLT